MSIKKRQSIIELWRFIASLLIMTCHLTQVGFEKDFPFYSSWIFVEFFFILTGYYTFAYLNKKETRSLNDVARNSIEYTTKRYFDIFPYIFVATSIYYLCDFVSSKLNITDIINYIFDVTLLTGAFKMQYAQISSLWYLSALFIVFPIFCLLCQIKSKCFLYIISFYFILYFYGYNDSISYSQFPYHIPRALAGLLLGVIVWGGLIQYLRKINVLIPKR